MKLAGSNKNLYGEFSKVEEQDDGTIIVEGIASSEAIDADGEIIKASAMEAALEDYMKFANVREMHQPKAAGTALDCFVDDKGVTRIKAHIVDGEAVKKVKTKTYKGFSVGGKATARDATNKSIITGMRLVEISLVDRPANPQAILEMWKAETIEGENEMDIQDYSDEYLAKRKFTAKERKESAKKGHAMPDGSFPIENKDDLENAIKAIGRAKDEEAAKKHIIARAKALKATDMLPADWEGSTKKEEKAEQSGEIEKTEEITEKNQTASDEDKTEMKKGLYGVSRLADLLQSLQYLVECSEQEEKNEGDDSAVPSRLKTAAMELGSILVTMAEEEVSELFANEDEPEVLIMMADEVKAKDFRDALVKYGSAEEIAKRGSRHNKADQEHIDAIHKHAVALGAKGGEAPSQNGTADENTDNKSEVASVMKMASDMQEQLKKVAEENEALQKRVKELEDLPQPAKGALMQTAVIGKAEDSAKEQIDPELVKAAEEYAAIQDPVEKSVFLMKTIHQRGGKKVA